MRPAREADGAEVKTRWTILPLCVLLSACASTGPAAPALARLDFTYDVDVPTLQIAAEDSLRRMGFSLLEAGVETGGGMVRAARTGSPTVIVQIAPTRWGSVARVQTEGGAKPGSLAREIQKEIARELGS